MSKELEALNKLQHDFGQLKGQELVSCYETIFNALKRLESIDNANPSEALEDLEALEQDIKDRVILAEDRQLKLCAVIKQALLKAQEPKQYLKWEDLEFKEMYKIIPVRMGDNVYQMAYCLYENEGYIRLEDCQRIYLELFANEKKFFNDLHLERVLE